MSSDHVPPQHPLDLEAVDRAIRMNELEEQAKDLGIGSSYVSDDCPPEAHEGFLKNMIEYETAPLGSHFDRLTSAGVELPPPDSLDDGTLHAKLWEVINALARFDTYLYHTDHLSDRQLYEHLWTESLREEGAMFPPGSGWRCHLDILGGCSEEDIQTSLRYYDDEETRQHWARDFPDDVIPPHEDPPYDRDRLLPSEGSGRPASDDGDEDDGDKDGGGDE